MQGQLAASRGRSEEERATRQQLDDDIRAMRNAAVAVDLEVPHELYAKLDLG